MKVIKALYIFLLLFSLILLGLVAYITTIPALVREQKIREKCYAIGIAAMPPTTDQSLIQSVPAYQECIKNGGKSR